jgi:hypothetical protein
VTTPSTQERPFSPISLPCNDLRVIYVPFDSPSFARAILLIVLSIASLGFQIAFNIYFGRQQTERRWASVFYLKALSPFLWMLGLIVCLFWLIRVTVLDRRDGHTRDSLHRFGVALELACYLATITLSLGTFLMMIFII